MNYHFNWSVLWSGQSGAWLLQGVFRLWRFRWSAGSSPSCLGLFPAHFAPCHSRRCAGWPAGYVEFFRNVPLLVWMFFWYFGVPPLLPQALQDWLFDHGAEFWAGAFALGVYHGARFSEVIRAGISAIPKTQFEAAASTGLTTSRKPTAWSSFPLLSA